MREGETVRGHCPRHDERGGQRQLELFLETNGHRVDEEGCRLTVPRPNPKDMFIGLGGGIGKARFLPFC